MNIRARWHLAQHHTPCESTVVGFQNPDSHGRQIESRKDFV